MLKRKERLDSKTFSLTFKQGKRINNEHVTGIYFSKNCFKAAVVVSKKIEKKAVKRNFWRRRVYALIREIKTDKVGYFIFLIKAKGVSLNRKDFNKIIKAEIKEILELK